MEYIVSFLLIADEKLLILINLYDTINCIEAYEGEAFTETEASFFCPRKRDGCYVVRVNGTPVGRFENIRCRITKSFQFNPVFVQNE